VTNEPVANILIVDDDAKSLVAMEALLSGPGRRLVRAESGSEALRCLLREDFVLVLLDVRLPDMDGFETAALIRQRESLRYVPIIFLSAIDTLEDDAYRGVASGAVDYLFKPVVPQVLQAKVSVFIDLFRMNERLKRQAVRQTEERFRLVIESLQDYAVCMLDTQGRSSFGPTSSLPRSATRKMISSGSPRSLATSPSASRRKRLLRKASKSCSARRKSWSNSS